jgi:fatty acid desaturase
MRNFARRARSPFGVGVIAGVALLLAGFAAIAFGWRGTARSLVVPLQIPYLVSGALAALGLIGAGAILLNTQWERLSDAEERRAMAAMIDEAALLLEARRSGARS